jgi:hypothetical protein
MSSRAIEPTIKTGISVNKWSIRRTNASGFSMNGKMPESLRRVGSLVSQIRFDRSYLGVRITSGQEI